MKVDLYERIWMWGVGLMLLVLFGSLARAAMSHDYHPPSHVETIDPRAVMIAKSNARFNRAAAEFIHARGVGARRLRQHGPFDLVLANILLIPLQQMAAPIAQLVTPNARVVVSGLLPAQQNAALAAYRALRREGGLRHDAGQMLAAEKLQSLHNALNGYRPSGNGGGWKARLGLARRRVEPPRGRSGRDLHGPIMPSRPIETPPG